MKDKILQFIGNGKTKEALEALATYNPEAILLQGKFNKIEKDERLGMLDYDTYTRELSKINYSIMSILDTTDFNDRPSVQNDMRGVGTPHPVKQKNVFLSYAKEDEEWQKRLRVHLAPLRRNNRINDWSEAEILPGSTMSEEVKTQLHHADIILLLVSPDFIASDKLWETDVKIAMERHSKEEAIVVPIILKPCQWKEMPFGNLKPLPVNGLPVTSWGEIDKAFYEVAEGIRKVIN